MALLALRNLAIFLWPCSTKLSLLVHQLCWDERKLQVLGGSLAHLMERDAVLNLDRRRPSLHPYCRFDSGTSIDAYSGSLDSLSGPGPSPGSLCSHYRSSTPPASVSDGFTSHQAETCALNDHRLSCDKIRIYASTSCISPSVSRPRQACMGL
jgi:hypothetical protein